MIKELFSIVGFKVGECLGGYVRVIKIGFRKGDGVEMVMIELVDFNDVYSVDFGESKGGGCCCCCCRGGKGGGVVVVVVGVVIVVVIFEEEE